MRLKVRVQPSSGRQEIQKLSDANYKVYLKKSPTDGKANEELIKLFKKELKLSVKIQKGHTSKDKTLEVII